MLDEEDRWRGSEPEENDIEEQGLGRDDGESKWEK